MAGLFDFQFNGLDFLSQGANVLTMGGHFLVRLFPIARRISFIYRFPNELACLLLLFFLGCNLRTQFSGLDRLLRFLAAPDAPCFILSKKT